MGILCKDEEKLPRILVAMEVVEYIGLLDPRSRCGILDNDTVTKMVSHVHDAMKVWNWSGEGG